MTTAKGESMVQSTFEDVYNEYFKKIYNYIYGQVLNREVAEDLTEDVFVRVIDNLDGYDSSKAAISTWIYTIAKNIITDYRKRAYVNRETEIDESVELISTTEKYYYDNPNTLKYTENRQLAAILTELTEDERDFLELRYGLELSNEEIAQRLNITAKAVSDRYRRLLDKCKKIHEKKFLPKN